LAWRGSAKLLAGAALAFAAAGAAIVAPLTVRPVVLAHRLRVLHQQTAEAETVRRSKRTASTGRLLDACASRVVAALRPHPVRQPPVRHARALTPPPYRRTGTRTTEIDDWPHSAGRHVTVQNDRNTPSVSALIRAQWHMRVASHR